MSQIEINQRSFKYGDYYLAKLEAVASSPTIRCNPFTAGQWSYWMLVISLASD
jgi:hypothetical protein